MQHLGRNGSVDLARQSKFLARKSKPAREPGSSQIIQTQRKDMRFCTHNRTSTEGPRAALRLTQSSIATVETKVDNESEKSKPMSALEIVAMSFGFAVLLMMCIVMLSLG
jgi:hypothetical protein